MDEASDPDENEPPHIHIFNLPPEMEEHVRIAHDRQEMANEAIRHEVKNFFDELSVDQLATLRMILDALTRDPHPHIRASFYEGVCTTLLEYKHGVCAACGQNHEEDLLNFTTDSATDGNGEDE